MNISQCRQINDRCNSEMEYRTDQEVYGIPDWWETVKEMVKDPVTKKLMLDCDGGSILKYDRMKEAGCPIEQLSMIICLYIPNQTGHMVSAWWEDPNDPWVMDIPDVEPIVWRLSERSDLVPSYAFNESRIWKINVEG